MQTLDGCHFSGVFEAIISDELGHGPRFERRPIRPEIGEMAEQHANQFVFAIPEVGQKFAFFFRCEQIRGKSRYRGFIGDFGRRNLAGPSGGRHGWPFCQ